MLCYAKSLQSCPTLCDPIDGSPPGSPVPGILQARTLEWVAISFSNAWRWKVKVKSLSRVGPSVTPWIAALQAPPSMEFSRQEYWSGVPLPSPISSITVLKHLTFCWTTCQPPVTLAQVISEHWAELRVLYSAFPLAICFKVSVLLCPMTLLSPCPHVHSQHLHCTPSLQRGSFVPFF